MNEKAMARPAQKLNTTKNSPVDGFKDQQTTIQGTLTSQIETKHDKMAMQTYHYGFFEIMPAECDGCDLPKQEIPVIFKTKPELKKGNKVKLVGKWANSNNSDRPSFTCHDYQILSDPPPPPLTTKILREQIQPLITTSLDKKQEWTQRVDFLFRKLDELKKLEELTELGSQYLQAHLLLKNAEYSAYHDGKLRQENFTHESYLERIQTEIQQTEKRIVAYQRKEETN